MYPGGRQGGSASGKHAAMAHGIARSPVPERRGQAPQRLRARSAGGMRPRRTRGMMGEAPAPLFAVDAICFALLTALLDSWTLWEAVAAEAGGHSRGRLGGTPRCGA